MQSVGSTEKQNKAKQNMVGGFFFRLIQSKNKEHQFPMILEITLTTIKML